MTDLSSTFARGFAAIDDENLADLRGVISQAKAKADAADVRVRYFEFVAGWMDEATSPEALEESLADGTAILEEALDLDVVTDAARVVLDLAMLLFDNGEFDVVEAALETLSEREGLDPEADAEARIIRAQILIDVQDDPEEALEVLTAVDPALKDRPGYISLHAAVLMDLDESDAALELLRGAVSRHDEIDLRYQLGLGLRAVGEAEESAEHLLAVRAYDLRINEVDLSAPIPAEEVEDLRRYFEDVLDTLPEPVLNLVAAAAIRVERWISEDAVRAGADPRSVLAFEGEPASEDGGDGEVTAIVLFRDGLVAEIELDEDIPEAFALSLVDEAARFLDIELIAGV